MTNRALFKLQDARSWRAVVSMEKVYSTGKRDSFIQARNDSREPEMSPAHPGQTRDLGRLLPVQLAKLALWNFHKVGHGSILTMGPRKASAGKGAGAAP